ncbi:flippase-like domain-containing protein [Candidatus Woesearchaeota archaeon]|nr:flippase-like domain-containing protein [Candidatus Woesearchaeota archaeon]
MRLLDLLKYGLSAAALAMLLYLVGPDKIIATAAAMNPLLLPAIILLFAAGLAMGAYNLKILTDALGVKITYRQMTEYYLKSWAFGLIIPGKIGEFSFVYLARKHMTTGQAMAVSVLDKMITVITLLALSYIGFFIFLPPEQAIRLTLITAVAAAAGSAFLLTHAGRGLIKKLLGKYQNKFEGFSNALNHLVFRQRTAAALNLGITLLKWQLTAIVTYIAFLSFGQQINPLIILTISATAMLLSLIPITMSGLGVKEAASVYLYGLAGVAAPVTLSVQIVLLIINYLGAALVFLLSRRSK